MDMEGISAGKFAIDWDELPLSKKRYLMFKSSIAAEGGQTYSKKTKKYESYTRRVNFIGSTNKANRDRQKGYLLDDDDAIKRRIIPIDLTGRIDYEKYLNEIDLLQLWGEAASGILQAQKSQNKDILTWECDWTDLREQNARYIYSDEKKVSKDLLMQHLIPDENSIMNPSDILIELKKKKGLQIKLSAEQIGRLISKHKFEKGRKGNYKGYKITIK